MRLLERSFTGLILAPLVVAQPVRADDGAARLHLGEIKLHVLYRNSGRLSEDLLHGEGPRNTWNLVIDGGGLDEPADDAIAVLPIRADKEKDGNGEVFSSVPIKIRARVEGGKVIAERTISGVLTSGEGAAHLALWLPEVTCAGPLLVEATRGKQRVEGRFGFNCGE